MGKEVKIKIKSPIEKGSIKPEAIRTALKEVLGDKGLDGVIISSSTRKAGSLKTFHSTKKAGSSKNFHSKKKTGTHK